MLPISLASFLGAAALAWLAERLIRPLDQWIRTLLIRLIPALGKE
jgi:hypothetical protein